jgi:hypothetical protein
VSDFLVNPRRAPRAPSRCRANVQIPGATWATETEDIGPHGCQLVVPKPLPRGLAIQVAVTSPLVAAPLQAAGKIAWVSSQPPWRLGVAFAEAARAGASRWFDSLVAASPGLGNLRRVPDRLPLDAMVFLGPPPRFMVDFTDDEIEVLRHVAGGITLAALRDRLRATWGASLRSFFGLMARGLVTVSRGAAAHPEAWKKLMAEYQATFVVEQASAPPRPTSPPRREGSARAEQAALRAVEIGRVPEREAPTAATPPPLPPPPPRADAAVASPTQEAAPSGSATAGTGWRGAGRARGREAQEALDLGRQELGAARVSSALAHLRRALTLAPGDPEIAAELGKAMRGGA